MSIEKIQFTRGIKGKREEGSVTHVTFAAVGKIVDAVRKTKNPKTIAEERKNPLAKVTDADADGRVTITVPELEEDGIVTDLNEAMLLMPNQQAACDALVRHYNYLVYREEVAKVVGVTAPDELDAVIGDALTPEQSSAFKRTVSNTANLTGETRLEVAGQLLPKLIAKLARTAAAA